MAKRDGYDFAGWASINDQLCGDGTTIRRGAFSKQDGARVPLVYNHDHKTPDGILGHAYLENRKEGTYVYGYLNNTPSGRAMKEAIAHGDVDSLSVWANNLTMDSGKNIYDGTVREISLVLAGDDPGARVESVIAHGMTIEENEEEGIFYTGRPLEGFSIEHAAKEDDDEDENGEGAKMAKEENNEKGGSGKTVGEVINTMTDEQKAALAMVVEQAVKDAKGGSTKSAKGDNDDDDEDEEEEKEVKHNSFDKETGDTNFISHSAMKEMIEEARSVGSLKKVFQNKYGNDAEIMHSIDTTGMTTATGTQTYGFNDASMLFPDYKSLNNPPEWIKRDTDWVGTFMGAVAHTPFSRIKSVYANITEDDARALGYIKGKLKKEEVFTTLKRTTDPQTIYKKQKLDRDDVNDITDFDVVAWIKAEMRVMLDEEIARACLIGDGRLASSDDKIKEDHIRPIVNDVPLFNIKYGVDLKSTDNDDDIAKLTIRAAVKARKDYKGSGNPILFTTEEHLTNMLLIEDGIGHRLYKTEQELATAMRVSRIVTVEVMEGAQVDVTSGQTTTKKDLIGVIVNPKDYNIGADKGGAVSMFDDFDIDYNQQKYLIETRISGALVKPYSAITLYKNVVTS